MNNTVANNYPNLQDRYFEGMLSVMDPEITDRVSNEMPTFNEVGEFLTRYMQLDPNFPVNDFQLD
jgi:hypothetical protein